MSVWWIPQSVTWPPEYSHHQRKFQPIRLGVNGRSGAGPCQKSQSRSAGRLLRLERSLPIAVDRRRVQRDQGVQLVAQPPAAGDGHRFQEPAVEFRPLLRAHLQHGPVSRTTCSSILPSAIVRVSGFSQYTSLPAFMASMQIFVCQWSGVPTITTSTSLRSKTWR
jgi:hypothetical protein